MKITQNSAMTASYKFKFNNGEPPNFKRSMINQIAKNIYSSKGSMKNIYLSELLTCHEMLDVVHVRCQFTQRVLDSRRHLEEFFIELLKSYLKAT